MGSEISDRLLGVETDLDLERKMRRTVENDELLRGIELDVVVADFPTLKDLEGALRKMQISAVLLFTSNTSIRLTVCQPEPICFEGWHLLQSQPYFLLLFVQSSCKLHLQD